jgi:hypothetical protein
MGGQERAARFRELASKLRREPASTRDEAMRQALADLARQYDALAERAQRRNQSENRRGDCGSPAARAWSFS